MEERTGQTRLQQRLVRMPGAQRADFASLLLAVATAVMGFIAPSELRAESSPDSRSPTVREVADPGRPVLWNSATLRWFGGADAESASRRAASDISIHGAAVVGCDGVLLDGSGTIDTWDSTYGLYTAALAQGNALVTTLNPSSDLTISSAATIKGDLLAVRNLVITNTAIITGAYRAGNNIAFSGNPNCPPGIVQAGNIITHPGSWWLVTKCGNPPTWEQGADVALPQQACDPLDVVNLVDDLMDEYDPGSYANFPGSGSFTISSDAAYNNVTIGGVRIIKIDASQADYFWVNGNLSVANSGQLHFLNPLGESNPQEIRVFITGSFSTGGATKIVIDPGLSVRIYSHGTFSVGSGAGENILPIVNINGVVQPTFGVYTTYSSTGNGVTLSGSSPLTGVIYAPRTGMSISGSGHLYGAVRGKTVSITGSGWIHYDEQIGVTGGWDGGPVFPPDMGVWFDLDEDELGFNDESIFEITLANLMIGNFTNVEVDLTIPASLAYVSHTAPPGTTFVDTNSDMKPDRWQIPLIVAQDTMALQVVMRGLNIPELTTIEPEVEIGSWTGVDNEPLNNMASVTLDILPSPLLSVTKIASVSSTLPGEPITFMTAVTNLAQAPAHSVVVIGKIDSHLGLRLNTYGPMAPFDFIDGGVPSGVTMGTPEYSDDDGDTWDYVPISGGGGAPSGHDANVTHWRIPLVGVMNTNGAWLQIEYEASPL